MMKSQREYLDLGCQAPMIDGSYKKHAIESRMAARLWKAVAVIVIALIGARMPVANAQQGIHEPSKTIAIQGTVHDSAGRLVGDAVVRLDQKAGPGHLETKTSEEGAFTILAPGTGNYLLAAEKSGMHSGAISVTLSSLQDRKHIDLILIGSAAEKALATSSNSSPAQVMEFSDKPSFTIAAVTDWTAAGGHGSDTSLRTSEALTREALALKGNGSESRGTHAAASELEAELHRLAGEADEKRNDPLAAVHEFELAVRLDPSEPNFFEWGSELLLHRAVWQAQEVFQQGAKLYPRSARMLTALGTALFAGARYDEAALRLCDASDLNPADAEPYVFMGKIVGVAPNALPCIKQRLERFVREQPANSLANYFYALSVLKEQVPPIDPMAFHQIEGLFAKSVSIDPKCADAYFQLGNLYATQKSFEEAVGFYLKAIDANPELADAHYRLGVAFDRTGQQEKAKREFELHDVLKKQQAKDVERQREEVKQFLVVVPGQETSPETH
jgi:tetratricopeptide (TPR) repeat protein